MAITHYPRPAHPIVPRILKELFDAPIPNDLDRRINHGLKYMDLDEHVWQRFSPHICHILGESTGKYFLDAKLSWKMQQIRISGIPEGIKLSDMDLEVRTFNCLKKYGCENSAARLNGLTLGQVLEIKNFGKKSLLDLLTSLQFITGGAASDTPIKDDLQIKRIKREFNKLNKMRVAKCIHKDDPRFGHFIKAMNPKTNTLSELLSEIECQIKAQKWVDHSTLKDLRAAIQSAYGLKLEEELTSLLVRAKNDRAKKIMTRYFGFDGQGGATLQVVGDEFSITRERVRQICKIMETYFQTSRNILFIPILGKAVRAIERFIPEYADEIEKRLCDKRITRNRFQIQGINQIGELLYGKKYFEIVTKKDKRIVLPPNMVQVWENIWETAKKCTRFWGVSNIEDITARVSEGAEQKIALSFVRKVVTEIDGFRWLDEEEGWFWLKNVKQNRVLNRINKMLSIVPRMTLSELRSGISRHHRMKGYAPPTKVLMRLCQEMPSLSVEGSVVHSTASSNGSQLLNSTEKTFVEILKANENIMARPELEELCLEQGMVRSTFYVYLDYSPILCRFAPGVYGLRGADIPPGMVESLAPGRARTKVLQDYGWRKNGNPWLSYKLNKSNLTSGVFGVPAGMAKILPGKYELQNMEYEKMGTLVIKNTSMWGLGPFFRRVGGEEGDYVILVFNFNKKEVSVSLGDASLLEGFDSTKFEPSGVGAA